MIGKSYFQDIALRYYKFSARVSGRVHPISIFEQLEKASDVLVCPPSDEIGFKSAIANLQKFREIFSNAQITFLDNQAINVNRSGLKQFRIIEFDEMAFTPLGLPTNQIRNNVANNRFDVVIDLSIPFNFLNTALAWASKADLRICFKETKREELYNFMINTEANATVESSYNCLFKYLGANANQPS